LAFCEIISGFCNWTTSATQLQFIFSLQNKGTFIECRVDRD